MPKKTLIVGAVGAGKTNFLLSRLRYKNATLWDITESLSRKRLEDPAYLHVQIVRGLEIPIGSKTLSGEILAVDDIGRVFSQGETSREAVKKALGDLVKASRRTVSDIIVTTQMARGRVPSKEEDLADFFQDVFDEVVVLEGSGRPPNNMYLERPVPDERFRVTHKSRFERDDLL